MHVTSESAETLSSEDTWSPEEDAPSYVRQKQQRGPVDPYSEGTLIHEIGHHVSHVQGRSSARYRTETEQGGEEGFADRFMIEHYRQDPRGVRWAGRQDPREQTYLSRGQTQEKFGVRGHRAYEAELGKENRPPGEEFLGKTLEESAYRERWDRPMLDEFLPEHQQIFNEEDMKGWLTTDPREVAYKKAAQRMNTKIARRQNRRGELKQRWEPKNRLGRQFGESQGAES